MEKVSIIMPTYNQAEYIREAIDSIIGQDSNDWKLYIINDGSTDNTEEIAKEYQFKHPTKIEYHYKPNTGVGDTLNFGFDLAKGIYHTYVSSDNVYFHDFIIGLESTLDGKHDIGLVYSDYDVIDATGKVKQRIKRSPHIHGSLINCCITGLCFMWRAELYNRLGKFDNKYIAHDYDFFLKIEEVSKITHIPYTLGLYRDHSKTLSNQNGLFDTPEVVQNAKKRRGIK